MTVLYAGIDVLLIFGVVNINKNKHGWFAAIKIIQFSGVLIVLQVLVISAIRLSENLP